MPKNLINDLYTGASGVGKIWTLVTAIISTLICLLMFALGIYIIYHKNYLKQIEGKIVKSSYDCSVVKNTTTNKGSSNTSESKTCRFDVQYTVDNKNYTKTFSSSDIYSVDNIVTIWYDPNHPDRSEFNPASKIVGWFIIGLSFFILFGAWFMVWFTRHNKFIAASVGAGAGMGLIKSTFNRI